MPEMKSEFTAVILAATFGSRLYPLTSSGKDEMEDYFDIDGDDDDVPASDKQMKKKSGNGEEDANECDYLPKHLLPLAGRPIIHHLIDKLKEASLNNIVIAISAEDQVTASSLIEMGAKNVVKIDKEDTKSTCIVQNLLLGTSYLKVVRLPSECNGSADALRFITALSDNDDDEDNDNDSSIIPNGSHLIVLPGDLILYGNLCSDEHINTLGALVDEHRHNFRIGMTGEGQPVALTMVLADVGEIDENGAPLKESAKAKRGGIAREDEDIDYIALSEIPSSSSSRASFSTAKRIIIKQSKFHVEDDEDNTGKTPKLNIPKARLHSPINQMLIRTDWNDIHLFCFAPWVLKLIATKIHLKDLASEIVPLLVESQFKGIKACLGIQNQNSLYSDNEKGDTHKLQVLGQILNDSAFQNYSKDYCDASGSIDKNKVQKLATIGSLDFPFTVLAQTLTHQSSKLTLRTCNLPSYSYACREVVSHAIKNGSTVSKDVCIPGDAVVDAKSNSIMLTSSLGEKVQIKSSTIGKNVTVGNRCRLNNVVVMDDVTIGDNCILQNSVLSKGCKLGDNCNLNDCQLGPMCSLDQGTKAKGESYVRGDLE